jgi:arylsulfatase A
MIGNSSMRFRRLLAAAGLGAALGLAAVGPLGSALAAEPERPNVVLIFADDLGYGDLGSYGGRGYDTPHLDRLAREGVRFTDFYAAQPICSASRAALLTGCYPNRIGILGALGPNDRHGIHDDEQTLAEVLKLRGYATAIYGKWHLGRPTRFLPTRHGFDEYFGLPYSNDMWPGHPESPKAWPSLPLIEGERPIAFNPDQTRLTTWYADHAVRFIEQHHDRPFFVYLAHSMPHVPLFVSEKFAGKTERGIFGDVIEEIDWSVGQILDALARLELDSKTLVIFTSDNGPWLSYGDHAGSAGPLREGKATTFEGGVREPCLMRWPDKIPAGAVCREPAMTIDLLPTLARLAGEPPADGQPSDGQPSDGQRSDGQPRDGQHPADCTIDGRDIWPLMSGEPGAKSPHDALYFYWGRELQAVRSRRWKLHLPHNYRSLDGPGGRGGVPAKYVQRQIGLALFDLEQDPGETTNLAAEQPDVVARLQEFAEHAREDLGDSAMDRPGKNVRPAGSID